MKGVGRLVITSHGNVGCLPRRYVKVMMMIRIVGEPIRESRRRKKIKKRKIVGWGRDGAGVVGGRGGEGRRRSFPPELNFVKSLQRSPHH